MGWLRENPRLAALALASCMVCWAWVAFGGPLPHLPDKDQAAWVQAYGSIGAIIASGILAIWVPIHMRAVAEHDAVQRAINSAIIACGGASGAWESTRETVDSDRVHAQAGDILGVQIGFANSALHAVPLGMLMGASYAAIVEIGLKLKTIELLMNNLSKHSDPSGYGKLIPFEVAISELKEVSDSLVKMKPRKVAGHWMIWSPDDEVTAGANGDG